MKFLALTHDTDGTPMLKVARPSGSVIEVYLSERDLMDLMLQTASVVHNRVRHDLQEKGAWR